VRYVNISLASRFLILAFHNETYAPFCVAEALAYLPNLKVPSACYRVVYHKKVTTLEAGTPTIEGGLG